MDLYTNNLCISGTPISSRNYPGEGPELAFDGNLETFFATGVNPSTSDWLGYVFSEPKKIQKMKITQYGGNFSSKGLKVRYSKNGTDYIDVKSFTVNGEGGEYLEFKNQEKATHWIIQLTEGTVGASYGWTVKELEMYEMLEKAMIIKSKGKYYVQSSDRNSIIEIPEANLEYAARYGSPDFTDFTKVINTLQVLKNEGTASEYLEPQTVDPFCLYDLFADEIEVIYLTDAEVAPTTLSVECDWSPLDELGDNYELLIWSSQEDDPSPPVAILDVIPKNQTLVAVKPLYFQELQKVTVNFAEAGCGKVFIHVSGDNGSTWHKYRAAELNALTAAQLSAIFTQKQMHYKVELECDHNEDIASFKGISINNKDYYATQNFKDFLLSVESVMEKMPRIYISYDNEISWIEVKQNEMNNLTQEEVSSITMKIVLENGQELYAVAYSWI